MMLGSYIEWMDAFSHYQMQEMKVHFSPKNGNSHSMLSQILLRKIPYILFL